jgi:hypothetical protein
VEIGIDGLIEEMLVQTLTRESLDTEFSLFNILIT